MIKAFALLCLLFSSSLLLAFAHEETVEYGETQPKPNKPPKLDLSGRPDGIDPTKFKTAMYYSQQPTYEFPPGLYGTGLAYGDFNRDGFMDVVVSAGNDKAPMPVVMYLGAAGGTFKTPAAWTSTDLEYNGNVAVADLNNDGYLDIACARFLGGSTSAPTNYRGGGVKVYYGGGFYPYMNATYSWTSNSPLDTQTGFPCYAVAIGDFDADGDLDIAAAAGEVIPETESFANSTCPTNYATRPPIVTTNSGASTGDSDASTETASAPRLLVTPQRRLKGDFALDGVGDQASYCVGTGPNPTPFCVPMVVYLNNGTNFNRNWNWTTSQAFVSDDVVFADVDRNGYMDLIFGGPLMQVYLANANGSIGREASWTASRINYDGGYTAFQWNMHPNAPDGISTIAMAATNYMGGGDGKYKVWQISNPYQTQFPPFQGTESWSTATGGWGGGVGLTDVNGDGNADLITAFWVFPNGGWPNWAPIVIYPGNNLLLENTASWWSIPSGPYSTNTVVESIKFFNFNKLCRTQYTEYVNATGMNFLDGQVNRTTFYVNRFPVVSIDKVALNGFPLSPLDYNTYPGGNWVSLKIPVPINATLIIVYTYSPAVDMINTNWNCDRGTFFWRNNICG